jgi:cytoskeletal protein CcmA (bactofilin family)
MFGKGKNDGQQDAASSVTGSAGKPAVQRSSSADAGKKADTPQAISSIGADMTIVGKIVCDGVLQVFGRIEGELRATNVLIGSGAHVEGEILAQDLTVDGVVKGVIHATRVKLHGTAEVQGDIFHRSLSMEENARFEGSSRRQENPVETPASVQEGPSLQPQEDRASMTAASEGLKVSGL